MWGGTAYLQGAPRLAFESPSQLGQGGLEVSTVAIGAHPAFGTRDWLEVSGGEAQELVGLACEAPDADAIHAAFYGAHSSDAAVRDADAVADDESFWHAALALAQVFERGGASAGGFCAGPQRRASYKYL